MGIGIKRTGCHGCGCAGMGDVKGVERACREKLLR
jgi:hypothetical protein